MTTDRFFFMGIKEIAYWLNRPENRYEYVLILLEDKSGEKNEADTETHSQDILDIYAEFLVDADTGESLIFTPWDRLDKLDAGSPHGWPSRREMILSNKRVIIFRTGGYGESSSAQLSSRVQS